MFKNAVRKQNAFTLVEVLIVSVILSLFFGGLYSLFGGGQRIAAKSSWLQYTIDRLRITQQAIFKAIKTSSYPSTILPSKIYDAGGKDSDKPGANAASYYIRMPAGPGKIQAKDIIQKNGGVFLITTRSEPEMTKFQNPAENKQGKIFWNMFYMKPSANDARLGIIYMDEKIDSYSTEAPLYAEDLNLKSDSAKKTATYKLAEDIEWIDFECDKTGYTPSEINITISAQYYRDKNLNRESSIKAVPNVGIRTD